VAARRFKAVGKLWDAGLKGRLLCETATSQRAARVVAGRCAENSQASNWSIHVRRVVISHEWRSTRANSPVRRQRMKHVRNTILLLVIGLAAMVAWDRHSIRESGHGFVIGDQIVLAEYGYSRGGDVLRWAILRTWPKDSTAEQRLLDPRVSRSFLVWPLLRAANGRLVPIGTDGNVYLFDGDKLKTMRVRMNEHTDTIPLEDSQTLEEMWAYLERFRVDGSRRQPPIR